MTMLLPWVWPLALMRYMPSAIFWLSGKSRIDQDDLATCVYQIVLETTTITDIDLKLIDTLFSAKCERLGVESVFSEFYCFDFPLIIFF